MQVPRWREPRTQRLSRMLAAVPAAAAAAAAGARTVAALGVAVEAGAAVEAAAARRVAAAAVPAAVPGELDHTPNNPALMPRTPPAVIENNYIRQNRRCRCTLFLHGL